MQMSEIGQSAEKKFTNLIIIYGRKKTLNSLRERCSIYLFLL